jgi:Ca2+/H+ antiporter
MDQPHWLLSSLEQLNLSIFTVGENLYKGTSTFHRVLISQVLLAIAAIQILRPSEPDPLLSVILDTLKVGLAADCIFAVTVQLRCRSGSNRFIDFLLYKCPFVVGSFTELAFAVLLFRSGEALVAEQFLVGSIYAKLMAMGGLCLITHGLFWLQPTSSVWKLDRETTIQLLTLTGTLVLASALWIGSKFAPPQTKSCILINSTDERSWITMCVPLYLIVHVALTYGHLMRGQNPISTTVAIDGDVGVSKLKRSGIAPDNTEWVVLFAALVVLRAVAAALLFRLLEHLHTLTAIPPTNTTVVNFVFFPLVVLVIDHSVNAGLAVSGDLNSAWENLVQSTLSTYFFLRPLAALAGQKVDPAGGSVGFGFCLMAIAACLSIPNIPSKFQSTRKLSNVS